jgi:hypothetical protein
VPGSSFGGVSSETCDPVAPAAETLDFAGRAGVKKTMLRTEQIEELVTLVASMDHDTLVERFRSYPARFPIDFTDDFLRRTPLDRLRHIFVAMCLQNQRMPGPHEPAAMAA